MSTMGLVAGRTEGASRAGVGVGTRTTKAANGIRGRREAGIGGLGESRGARGDCSRLGPRDSTGGGRGIGSTGPIGYAVDP